MSNRDRFEQVEISEIRGRTRINKNDLTLMLYLIAMLGLMTAK